MEIRKYGKNKEQVFRIYNSGQLTDIKHKSQFVSEMKIAIDEMKNELELTETIPPICKKYDNTSLCTMLNYYSSEQLKLLAKTVGVVGLSVGCSIVKTLVMEGICGKVKIADYDTLDLSNTNRIDWGVFDVGKSKIDLVYR